jgi:hypothetical protein
MPQAQSQSSGRKEELGTGEHRACDRLAPREVKFASQPCRAPRHQFGPAPQVTAPVPRAGQPLVISRARHRWACCGGRWVITEYHRWIHFPVSPAPQKRRALVGWVDPPPPLSPSSPCRRSRGDPWGRPARSGSRTGAPSGPAGNCMSICKDGSSSCKPSENDQFIEPTCSRGSSRSVRKCSSRVSSVSPFEGCAVLARSLVRLCTTRSSIAPAWGAAGARCDLMRRLRPQHGGAARRPQTADGQTAARRRAAAACDLNSIYLFFLLRRVSTKIRATPDAMRHAMPAGSPGRASAAS